MKIKVSFPVIPFHKRTRVSSELEVIEQILLEDQLSGDGHYTQAAQNKLESWTGTPHALITPSGTAALELCCLLLNLQLGDEVILPSYTFSSCPNAIALRGAIPVFVDVQKETLNIDPDLIEQAITDKTKAIMVVHYGGVVCDMDRIMAIANAHNLYLIEDAAQAIGSAYKGKPAGSFGHAAAFSFHSTKNITSGEGGAFVTKDKDWAQRAEIIREKGTNRRQFMDGNIDKYSWVDIGSSYLPSELQSALLHQQLLDLENITSHRLDLWQAYYQKTALLEQDALLYRLTPPDDGQHNGHLFAVVLAAEFDRGKVIRHLSAKGIKAVFHYVPLHNTIAGHNYCRSSGRMAVTDRAGSHLLRLPLYQDLTLEDIDIVINALTDALRGDDCKI